MSETIEISKEEYKDLMEKFYILQALEIFGVDNWDGFSLAIDFYHENYADRVELK